MEQLTKVRAQAFVVGLILGLIVFGLAMFLRERKFINKATGRYVWCGNQTVLVSPNATSVAPNGAQPDTFTMCTDDSVTWTKANPQILEFKIHFMNGSPFSQTDFDSDGSDSVASGPASSPFPYSYQYYKYSVSVKVGGSWTTFPDPGGIIWK